MKLPPSLVHVRAQLDAAILDHPVLVAWDEGTKYIQADQPRAIAKVLIHTIRDDIRLAKIAYLFTESMKRGEMLTLGKCTKAGGAGKFLHHYDFIIVFNWTAWRLLTHEQKLALVDHELLHCAFDVEKGFSLLQHEVEDFVAIVDRWGLWTRGLQELVKAVTPQAQRDLFALQDRLGADQRGAVVVERLLDQAERGASGLEPVAGSSIESVTLSHGARSVTLTPSPPPVIDTENLGPALAEAARRGEDGELDAPVRRPRERLVHTKKRPAGRGKAES